MTTGADSHLPRVLFLTREIPQGANAGSQQLLRVLRDSCTTTRSMAAFSALISR